MKPSATVLWSALLWLALLWLVVADATPSVGDFGMVTNPRPESDADGDDDGCPALIAPEEEPAGVMGVVVLAPETKDVELETWLVIVGDTVTNTVLIDTDTVVGLSFC